MNQSGIPDFANRLNEFETIGNFDDLAKIWKIEEIRSKFRRVVVRFLYQNGESETVSGLNFEEQISADQRNLAQLTYNRCIDGVFTSLLASPDHRIIFRGIKPSNDIDQKKGWRQYRSYQQGRAFQENPEYEPEFDISFPVVRNHQFELPDETNTFVSMYREICGDHLFELTCRDHEIGNTVSLNTFTRPVYVESEGLIPFLSKERTLLKALLINHRSAPQIHPHLEAILKKSDMTNIAKLIVELARSKA